VRRRSMRQRWRRDLKVVADLSCALMRQQRIRSTLRRDAEVINMRTNLSVEILVLYVVDDAAGTMQECAAEEEDT
jgi:hypothetical protein